MRKLINVICVTAGLMLSVSVANAQQKLGHINSEAILSVWGDWTKAATEINNLSNIKQQDIDKMIAEYQTKLKAAQDKEDSRSVSNQSQVNQELEKMGKELNDLQTRIQAAREKAQKDIEAKQQELFSPLHTKIGNVIKNVAKEKGFAYIFDIAASQGFNNIIYSDGGEDITAEVKSKLGISATATTAPAPAANKPAAGGTKPKN